jgi:hypothetical protein
MEKTYIKNEECQNLLNDLELLSKEQIIKAVLVWYDHVDVEATYDMKQPGEKYMVNEFGRVKRTILNRLKNYIKVEVSGL